MQGITRILFLLAVVAAPLSAGAQTVMGTITGHIKDPSGGVLPGVTVTMTQLETGHKASAVTDSEGRFASGPCHSAPIGSMPC